MSIGHYLDENDILDPDRFISMFTYDEDRMGIVRYLEIKPSDYLLFQGDEKYVIWVGPNRNEKTVKGYRVMISTGDNAVGFFKTAEDRDNYLKRFVNALMGKISILIRVRDEAEDEEMQKRHLKSMP